MASSVEGREPFLDHELVEFVMALPPQMKHRGGQGKHVLREAMRVSAPARDPRAAEAGVRQPDGGVAARRLRLDAQAAVRGSALAERGLLDYEVVDRLFAAHRHGRGDWSKHLWTLYCVSRWYDRWVARSPTAVRLSRLSRVAACRPKRQT